MTSVFLYGTLRYLPLLEIVLGRGLGRSDVETATLPDHSVYWAQDQSFPMIVAEKGAVAEGLVIRNVGETELARMDFYESGFTLDTSLVEVVTLKGARVSVQVFIADSELWVPGAVWSLADWQSTWSELLCRAAPEVMSYFGVRSDLEIAQMFPTIQARAAAQLNATLRKRVPAPSGLNAGNVQISSRSRAYAKFYALDEFQVAFDRFDGTSSGLVERAVFIGADAAFVLPYDPVRDRVLLIEQMRMGPLARGDREVWQLEAIAGLLDPGETPEQTVVREAMEEAGLDLDRLESVAEYYPSGGCSSEYFYIYLGLADLPDVFFENRSGGVASENEDIRSHCFDFSELMKMVDDSEISNGPLVAAALWLARHRKRLREANGSEQ